MFGILFSCTQEPWMSEILDFCLLLITFHFPYTVCWFHSLLLSVDTCCLLYTRCLNLKSLSSQRSLFQQHYYYWLIPLYLLFFMFNLLPDCTESFFYKFLHDLLMPTILKQDLLKCKCSPAFLSSSCLKESFWKAGLSESIEIWPEIGFKQ